MKLNGRNWTDVRLLEVLTRIFGPENEKQKDQEK
jgi:hypothetical protein